VNAIPVPKVLQMLSGWLAQRFPTMKVPLGNLTMLLTHDQTITARHFQDERDGIRASAASVRFAHALTSAQKELAGGLSDWRFPLFAVVAGDDKLADSRATESLLRSVPEGLLDYHYYPANYHENFNEVNRDVIFAAILAWIEKLLAPVPA
jgi:lysophospholipase